MKLENIRYTINSLNSLKYLIDWIGDHICELQKYKKIIRTPGALCEYIFVIDTGMVVEDDH